MTTREPRFTEQDRAELIAIDIYRAGLCPKCGQPLSVCTSDEDAPGAPQFDVLWSTCRATRAVLEHERATSPDDKPHPNARAHLRGTTIRRG